MGAGLAISVGMCILATRPLAQRFEQWSYDLPYRVRPDIAADGVVVVPVPKDVDAASRQFSADLLDLLMARGARAVAFTTTFSDAPSTNADDRVFAQALRRARGKVVLAAGTTNGVAMAPNPELAAVAPWGLLAMPGGTDEVIRRHPSSAGHATLAFRVAQLLGRTPPTASSSCWMNYYAPDLRLPEVGAEQILRKSETPAGLKGRIVLVGGTSTNSETFSTPYGPSKGHRLARSEVEATAILNLSRREWLSRLPAAAEAGIVVLVGALIGLAFTGMRRGGLILLASGSVVVVVVGSYLLFAKLRFWFPWLVVAGAQIPLAFTWAWMCDALENPRIPWRVPIPSQVLSPSQDLPAPAPVPAALSPAPAAGAGADELSIPDHTLARCIGRGAYGEVWLARDVIGRYHAVKIVKERSFPHVAPYEREFKGIEQFASVSRNQPGLVQVLHIGRNNAKKYFFYIMELADDANGVTPPSPDRYEPKTLASEIARRGHLPVQESLRIGLSLCAALQHLHERRLVHRDVKPSNIIYVEGRVKIADIGLVAPIATDAADLTRLGTEGYLSPEGPGTPLADLYALGKVLYEISMGRDVWQFPEFPTTLGARPDEDELRRLHEIILTACENDPSHRYQSTEAMHAALSGILVT